MLVLHRMIQYPIGFDIRLRMYQAILLDFVQTQISCGLIMDQYLKQQLDYLHQWLVYGYGWCYPMSVLDTLPIQMISIYSRELVSVSVLEPIPNGCRGRVTVLPKQLELESLHL